MLNCNKSCDCVWQGVCILNELKHNNCSELKHREEYLCDILKANKIEEDTYHLKIKIPSDIAKYLTRPGAYLMLKSSDKNNDIFNTPISVMDVNDDILEVVIKAIGVKTKNIVNCNKVYVKAPYFNGIFGIKEIKESKRENTLVMMSGLSQVNAIKVIKKLLDNQNKVDVFINNKGIMIDEVIKKIENLGVNIYYFNFEEELDYLNGHIKENNISFVYSASSMIVSKLLMDKIDEVNSKIKFAISNNNLICCGEGVCGACAIDVDGEIIKTCKSQIDSRRFLKAKF